MQLQFELPTVVKHLPFCAFFRDRYLQKKVPFQELGFRVRQPSPRFVKVESVFAGDLQVERKKYPSVTA